MRRSPAVGPLPGGRVAPHRPAREHRIDQALLDVVGELPGVQRPGHLARVAGAAPGHRRRCSSRRRSPAAARHVVRLVALEGREAGGGVVAQLGRSARSSGSARSGRAREHEAEPGVGHDDLGGGHAVGGRDEQPGHAAKTAARPRQRRGQRGGRSCRHLLVEAGLDHVVGGAQRQRADRRGRVGRRRRSGSTLPSTTYRLGTSWARFQRSTTDVRGSSPILAVPSRCQPE